MRSCKALNRPSPTTQKASDGRRAYYGSPNEKYSCCKVPKDRGSFEFFHQIMLDVFGFPNPKYRQMRSIVRRSLSIVQLAYISVFLATLCSTPGFAQAW